MNITNLYVIVFACSPTIGLEQKNMNAFIITQHHIIVHFLHVKLERSFTNNFGAVYGESQSNIYMV